MNGSGKHNNWSIGTDDGTNLFNVPQLAKNSGSTEIFPVIMAAIIKAVAEHGDLMRLSIAAPGNDFRLGACEAPPAIVSTYLGEEMTKYLEGYMNGDDTPYNPAPKILHLGSAALPPLELPCEDRNRTSPFPYGGHRFEFRAVGSSQNVSLVNTVLAAISAKSFKEFADAIEAGQTAKAVAQAALKSSWKAVFNGNGYDAANQEMLTKNGVWRIDSGVEAIGRYTAPKNIQLFEELHILSAEDCAARERVMYNQYVGTVEVEAKAMVDMIQQHVIPTVKTAKVGPLAQLEAAVDTLKYALEKIHQAKTPKEKAHMSRVLRLETMIAVREVCDAAEEVVPAHLWTLATYKELLFLDQHVQ